MSSLYDSINETTPAALPQQCKHITKRGNQCPRSAAPEEEYCILHGASIERTKEYIQRRLMALQEKSVAVIEEIFDSGEDKVRLAAATVILDRTGLGPKSTISLDTSADFSKMTNEQLAAELDTLAKQAREEVKRQRMDEALMQTPSASASRH